MTKISTGGGSGEPSTERNWRSKSDQIQSAWIGVPALSTFYPRGVGGGRVLVRERAKYFLPYSKITRIVLSRVVGLIKIRLAVAVSKEGWKEGVRRVEGRSERRCPAGTKHCVTVS
jgi:hypothetical protein